MLIGIDASRAVRARPTGTENYSRRLVVSLARLRRHALRLYLPVSPPLDFYTELIGTGSIEFRVIPFPRLWTHLRLSAEMLLNPPDVLFVPAHVIPLAHPPRSVVTVHDVGYRVYPWAHPLLDRLYLEVSTRYNVKVARRVIADSAATRRDIVRFYGVSPRKVKVVYPGVDPSFRPVDKSIVESVKARYGIRGEYFLFVGTVQPRKNVVRLAKAFELFRRRTKAPVKLVIAGKRGWLYRKAAPPPSEDILLLGYVPREHLPALMSGARLFVFPSLYEGFGFPVLEAMACGTPVMCSTTSSLPEVAGDVGFLVDPLNVEEMAAVMQRVWEEGVPRELIARGMRRAEGFSWARCAADVMSVLEEAGG